MEAYKPFFKALMDDAVWVPVFNGEYDMAHSESLHGSRPLTHPEHTIRYERLWQNNVAYGRLQLRTSARLGSRSDKAGCRRDHPYGTARARHACHGLAPLPARPGGNRWAR